MNLKERRELQNELVKELNFPRYLASYSSWQQYFISKTRLVKIMNNMNKKYGDPILKESNPKKLVKTSIKGKLELLASYPLFLGGTLATLITQDIKYGLGAGLIGVYLNWKGEIEMMASGERIKELGINYNKTLDDLFNIKK